jgi:hypothetical protein
MKKSGEDSGLIKQSWLRFWAVYADADGDTILCGWCDFSVCRGVWDDLWQEECLVFRFVSLDFHCPLRVVDGCGALLVGVGSAYFLADGRCNGEEGASWFHVWMLMRWITWKGQSWWMAL